MHGICTTPFLDAGQILVNWVERIAIFPDRRLGETCSSAGKDNAMSTGKCDCEKVNQLADKEVRNLPLFITVKELAQLLRINRTTVYELAQRGEIPGKINIGRSLRFNRDTVLMWLTGNHCASHK